MVQKGFTLIEIIIVVGILLMFFAITVINLGRIPSSVSQETILDILATDIRSQQTKAMAGNTSYGITFGSNEYTLVPSNYVVTLDPGITFANITFTNNAINFSPGAGETDGGSLSIVNSKTGDIKVLRINKYGAIY